MIATNPTIRVAVFRPGQPMAVEHLENCLEAMQELVGGYIQDVPTPSGLSLICNDEGKLLGLPPNRHTIVAGGAEDIICGTFFLCRADENGDYADLTDDDIASIHDTRAKAD